MMRSAGDMECPKCEHEWFEDGYFEMGVGSEMTCPSCGVSLSVCNESHEVMWDISTTAEYEAQQKVYAAQWQRAHDFSLAVITARQKMIRTHRGTAGGKWL